MVTRDVFSKSIDAVSSISTSLIVCDRNYLCMLVSSTFTRIPPRDSLVTVLRRKLAPMVYGPPGPKVKADDL